MAKKDEINKSMHEWMFKNNPSDKDGTTLLHWAAEKGHLDVCKSIIEEVEDKNPKDKKGWTPLHEAAREDHKEIFKLIFHSVQEKNPKDVDGCTPFHNAIENENQEIFEMISFQQGQKNSQIYWTPPTPDDTSSDQTFEEAVDRLEKTMREAVAIRMASDVPVNLKGLVYEQPWFVKSHSSVQTSQNLFDPYRISHASHGVIGYLAASWFGLDLGGGLIVAIVSASLWEMLENTNLIINQFRENSGTSESYEGDSRINVVGDVISCATGYTLAHVGHEVAGPWFPFAWLVASELVLAVTIRDNMLLMALQLIAPSETIKHWQQEIISPSSETFSIQKPKSTRYGKLVLQKTVNRNL